MANDSKMRFSSRVENYVKYRPGYPDGVMTLLREQCGLRPQSVVADVGSGTGISSEPFLKLGNVVYAIEPNDDMRAAAERLLGATYPNLRSVAGSAEATGLGDASVDLIVAGQAFHWFDRRAAKSEFRRILKPGGSVAILWNKRDVDTTPFLREYEQLLLTYGTDYTNIRHENVSDEALRDFFAPMGFTYRTFHNVQRFDFDGLRGRLLSSSYVPREREPGHQDMLVGVGEIFQRHAREGRVDVEYTTQVYYGKLD